MANALRKGDKIQIIAGKDRGKKGKILNVNRKKEVVIIEGVNLMKKHGRATQKNPQGGIMQTEGPIHVSNIQIICPSCGQLTRPKINITETEKYRLCRKCQAQM